MCMFDDVMFVVERTNSRLAYRRSLAASVSVASRLSRRGSHVASDLA